MQEARWQNLNDDIQDPQPSICSSHGPEKSCNAFNVATDLLKVISRGGFILKGNCLIVSSEWKGNSDRELVEYEYSGK